MSQTAAQAPPKSPLQHLRGFALGGLAACGAVTFTNPWEVVKTRLQLQGELESRRAAQASATATATASTASSTVSAAQSAKAYPNALSAFWRILRNEGIAGIQKGLAPAYVYQLLLNGTRLGMYEPLKHTLQASMDSVAAWVRGVDRIDGHAAPFVAMIASGATTGIIGSFIASPLFLVKTRMQSYVQGSGAVVGHQHSYVTKGTLYSLRAIYNSGGLRGLWRGADASMMRTGIGSAVQLSSYDTCKQMLLRSGWFDPARGGANGAIELHFMASLATSFLVCAAMNPFDVASTRMYNQHSAPDGRGGVLYKNGLDCLVKTVRAEGPSALYKGFFAHYLRLGPHTVLTFVFFEQLRRLSQRLDEYLAKK